MDQFCKSPSETLPFDFVLNLMNPRKAQKLQKCYDKLGEDCLRILIVYDSQSVNRNTEKVARAIEDVLKEKGFEVNCLFVKDADPANVKTYDCVIAGAPTMAFRASKPIIDFLDRLDKDDFSGKLGATFDTQVPFRFSGNAAKGIEKKLEKLGFKIITPHLVTYVEGNRENIHLKEGELEKTKKYAEDLAKALQS